MTFLFEPVYDCLEAICSDRIEDAQPVSQEIAGVGVFTSYYIQVAITLLLCLIFWHCKYGMEKKDEDLFELVFGRLVDFQKAQFYFAIPLEVATIIVLSNLKDANYLNVAALTNATRACFLPLAFSFLTICIYEKPKPYLSIPSKAVEIAGLVLGVVCYYHIHHATGPEACGHHAAWTLCVEAWKTTGLTNAVVFNVFVFLIWTVCRILLFIFDGPPRSSNPEDAFRFTKKGVKQLVFRVLQLRIAGLLVLHICTIRITQNSLTDQSDWTFGQVIAVTIWLLVVVDFGYKMWMHSSKSSPKGK